MWIYFFFNILLILKTVRIHIFCLRMSDPSTTFLLFRIIFRVFNSIMFIVIIGRSNGINVIIIIPVGIVNITRYTPLKLLINPKFKWHIIVLLSAHFEKIVILDRILLRNS